MRRDVLKIFSLLWIPLIIQKTALCEPSGNSSKTFFEKEVVRSYFKKEERDDAWKRFIDTYSRRLQEFDKDLSFFCPFMDLEKARKSKPSSYYACHLTIDLDADQKPEQFGFAKKKKSGEVMIVGIWENALHAASSKNIFPAKPMKKGIVLEKFTLWSPS